jgi:hypothetical protein
MSCGKPPPLEKMLAYLYTQAQSFSLDLNPHRSTGTYHFVELLAGDSEDWISPQQREAPIRDGRYVSATVCSTVPGEGFTAIGNNIEEVVYACLLHCVNEIKEEKRFYDQPKAKRVAELAAAELGAESRSLRDRLDNLVKEPVPEEFMNLLEHLDSRPDDPSQVLNGETT